VQEERKEEEEGGRDGPQTAAGGEGRTSGTFTMKAAALCALNFSSPSAKVWSKRVSVTSSVVKEGKNTSKGASAC